MGRRGRRQRSLPRRSAKNKVASIPKVELRGHKIKVSPHPPEFVPVPWFNLTLRMTGVTDITSSTLINQLKQQLRLPPLDTNVVLDARVINIRGWGPLVPMNSATVLSPLRVAFWCLIPNSGGTGISNFGIQEEVYDFPDQVRRACVGYEYPLAQQQIVLNQNITTPILHITDGAGAGNVFYIRLLWRTKDSSLTEFDPVSGKFIY